ncbi:MAG: hypothetical protein WCA83_02805 [Azonexus sp.]
MSAEAGTVISQAAARRNIRPQQLVTVLVAGIFHHDKTLKIHDFPQEVIRA